MGVGRLDDEDYPAVAMGQAAELLEVQPAFLRSLDAAARVVQLQDELDVARSRIAELERELAEARGQQPGDMPRTP